MDAFVNCSFREIFESLVEIPSVSPLDAMVGRGTTKRKVNGRNNILFVFSAGFVVVLLASIQDKTHNIFGLSLASAFEVCGNIDSENDGAAWLPHVNNGNESSSANDSEGSYCPSGNTCCRMTLVEDGCGDGEKHREGINNRNASQERCESTVSWGCVASDMGAHNATCCSDGGNGTNTACPAGYECRDAKSSQRKGTGSYDCVRSPKLKKHDSLMHVLPRYRLCRAEENNRNLYGLRVLPPPLQHSEDLSQASVDKSTRNSSSRANLLRREELSLPTTTASELAYYSNLGPIDGEREDNDKALSGVEMALVVVHGALRNGDDYFCSAKATIELQSRYVSLGQQAAKNPNSILVIAPVFLPPPPTTVRNAASMEQKRMPGNSWLSFFYWNNDDKDGPWRYGADASGPVSGVSSFDTMDAIVRALKNTTLLPNLRKIVVAGHSSGGQFVQRWSLLTSPGVWPLSTPSDPITMHAIVANPSNYVYLTPLRFFESSHGRSIKIPPGDRKSTDSSWNTPPKDECPDYNQWEWGLDDGGRLDVPYRQRAFSRENRSEIVERYLKKRLVVYLIGNLDRCSDEQICDSHGLERTCADELQGRNRYERNARYWASLDHSPVEYQTIVGGEKDAFVDGDGIEKPGLLHKHHRIIVPNAGHDHSMMFQSKEGIRAIYYLDDTRHEQRLEDDLMWRNSKG